MIQISSGLIKGLKLASPKGKQTRPSSERLRQGIFNVLRHFNWPPNDSNIVDGSVVVDLFSGTGAWGLEALSNGAKEIWFVESHPSSLKTLQQNINIAKKALAKQPDVQMPKIKVLRIDAVKAYSRLPRTPLIFCDPPYEKGYFKKIDHEEAKKPRILEGGLFLFEAAKTEKLPDSEANLKLFDQKNYGDSVVCFYVKQSR